MSLALHIRGALLSLIVTSCTSSGADRRGGNAVDPSVGGSSGLGGRAGADDASFSHDGSVVGQGTGGDSSQQRDGSPLACTDNIGSCPAYSIGIWQVLLDAKDFGPSARFVAMGGQAALVAVGDGSFSVARLRNPSINSTSAAAYSSWPVPIADKQPIAVAEGSLSSTASSVTADTLIVLACDQARNNCSVLRSDVNQGALTPWQETGLPSGFLPRGVVLDTAAEPRAICVYGNGMLCLRDGWQPAIVPDPGLQLNDVAMGSLWSLAVGDHGRWFKRERADSGQLGAWQEQAVVGDGSVAQVDVQGVGGVMTGEGRTLAVVGAQTEFFACSVSGDIIALMLDPGGGGLGYMLMSTGAVLQHAMVTSKRHEPYCAYQQLALPGVVLKTGTAPCSASMNPRVLTEGALFGTNLCVLI